MLISLQQFRKAVQRLDDDTTLRLREDGRGLAVSRWQRFQVAVCDLFRSKQAISASKSLALFAFFNAIEEAQGGEMKRQAERTILPSPPRLTARTVISTLDTLDAHGGQHWLDNERTIVKITNSPGEVLQDAVTTISVKLIAQAQRNGLAQETCLALRSRYENGHRDSLGSAVANALRATTRLQDENGGISIHPLHEHAVEATIQQIVAKALAGEINRALFDQFRAGQPAIQALDAAARDPANAAIANLLTTPEAHATLEKCEGDFVADADGLLSLQALNAMRRQGIATLAARLQEKLEGLADLNLPDDDPAAEHLIETCLASPAPMNPAYFSALDTAAKEIGDTFEKRHKQTPAQQIRSFLMLGSSLCAQIEVCNAGEDAKTFIDLGVDLFVSRCPDATRNAIMQWTMDEQYAGKTVRTPIFDVAMGMHPKGVETPEDGGATAARILFERFADLARFYWRPKPKDD